MSTTYKSYVFALFLCVLVGAMSYAPISQALASPMSRVKALQTSVGTTVELVTDEFTQRSGWKSCTIWNNSATPLVVGDADLTSGEGFPICTDTAACPSAVITIDAAGTYYLSTSGTLTPNVLCGR